MEQFLDEFVVRLGDFIFAIAPEDTTLDKVSMVIGKQIIKQLDEYTPLREDLLQFISKIINNGRGFNIDLLINFLAKLYPLTEHSGQVSLIDRAGYDFYKILLHELFLSLIGLFLHRVQYAYIENLLYSRYRINVSYLTGTHHAYTVFYSPIDSIDTYYNDYWRQTHPNFREDLLDPYATLLWVRHSELIPMPILIEADLLCYHIAELNDFSTHRQGGNWYPLLHIFQRQSDLNVFQEIVSKRYFDKVKGIYGVKSVTELANKLEDYKNVHQKSRESVGRGVTITPIYQLIDLQKIASYK